MAIRIKWTNRCIPDGLRVYRSETPFDESNLPPVLASLGGGVSSYLDQTVAVDTGYFYLVEAFSGAPELSVYSDAIYIVSDDTEPPLVGWVPTPIGVNVGAEDGDDTGWNLSGVTVQSSSARPSSSTITPYYGSYMFRFEAVSTASGYQDIDVSGFSTEIDVGDREITLTGAICADYTDADSGQLIIVFLDVSDVEISRISGTVLSPVKGQANWTEDILEGVIPVGTRTIQVRMEGVRAQGSNLSILVDIDSLIIT